MKSHALNFFGFESEQQCELLRDPVHGEVHQTGRYLGDRAIYTCSPGWEIVGAEERVCQADGAWTNQEPFCKKRGKYPSHSLPQIGGAKRSGIVELVIFSSEAH